MDSYTIEKAIKEISNYQRSYEPDEGSYGKSEIYSHPIRNLHQRKINPEIKDIAAIKKLNDGLNAKMDQPLFNFNIPLDQANRIVQEEAKKDEYDRYMEFAIKTILVGEDTNLKAESSIDKMRSYEWELFNNMFPEYMSDQEKKLRLKLDLSKRIAKLAMRGGMPRTRDDMYLVYYLDAGQAGPDENNEAAVRIREELKRLIDPVVLANLANVNRDKKYDEQKNFKGIPEAESRINMRYDRSMKEVPVERSIYPDELNGEEPIDPKFSHERSALLLYGNEDMSRESRNFGGMYKNPHDIHRQRAQPFKHSDQVLKALQGLSSGDINFKYSY